MMQANTGISSPRLLIAAVFSSAVASVCCIGPFILLATGLSGAWMSRLMAVEPFQPLLILFSLTFVVAAGWQLVRNRPCSLSSSASVVGRIGTRQAMIYFAVLSLVIVLLSSEYWIPIIAA